VLWGARALDPIEWPELLYTAPGRMPGFDAQFKATAPVPLQVGRYFMRLVKCSIVLVLFSIVVGLQISASNAVLYTLVRNTFYTNYVRL
jgi:hypothetical protein